MSAAAAVLPALLQWFPLDPGPKDELHLILEHRCPLVFEQARLRWQNPPYGVLWALELQTRESAECAADPLLPALKRLYAVPIPKSVWFPESNLTGHVEDVLVRHVHSVENGNHHGLVYDLPHPQYTDAPDALAGIWSSPRHEAQGVSLHVDDMDRVTVDWNTFDRTGKPLWLFGTSSMPQADPLSPPYSGSIHFDLVSVSGGSFAGRNSPTVTKWGSAELTYHRCDLMWMSWLPLPGTGLQAGGAAFERVVAAKNTVCDLGEYAAARSAILEIIGVVTFPR